MQQCMSQWKAEPIEGWAKPNAISRLPPRYGNSAISQLSLPLNKADKNSPQTSRDKCPSGPVPYSALLARFGPNLTKSDQIGPNSLLQTSLATSVTWFSFFSSVSWFNSNPIRKNQAKTDQKGPNPPSQSPRHLECDLGALSSLFPVWGQWPSLHIATVIAAGKNRSGFLDSNYSYTGAGKKHACPLS